MKYSEYLVDKCNELTPQKVCKGNSHTEFVNSLLESTSFLNEINASLTTRFYCVNNNITEIPKCVCGKNVMANKKDNKLGFTDYCSTECSRKNKTVSNEILKKLEDYNWLYNQRIELKKSKETIAEELGCSITPVNKWIKIHDIQEVKYNKNNIDYSNTLHSYEWLYEKYIIDLLPLRDIAKLCDCCTNMVVLSLNKNDIKIRKSNDIKLGEKAINKLNDYDWLYNQYILKNKTAEQIANHLCTTGGTVINYLRKNGFEIKYTVGFSQKAIQWMEEIMAQEGIFIQHAGNIGEYKIEGTKYKVDGYCEETNTVYEFHGDRFHGNPDLFEINEECNPYNNKTALELYNKTKERENVIINLGYKLITIWENDFNKLRI